MLKSALGIRVHSGWAIAVEMSQIGEAPVVGLRHRLELTPAQIAGSKQPYHTAGAKGLDEASAFLEKCRNATRELAVSGTRTVLADANVRGHAISVCWLLVGSGKLPVDLKTILASHAMIHTAEGEFYRDAIRYACEQNGVSVCGIREKELLGRAEEVLCASAAEIQKRLAVLGKQVGPPWTQDEKLSALAAWVALREAH